jgi:hypothetical protein
MKIMTLLSEEEALHLKTPKSLLREGRPPKRHENLDWQSMRKTKVVLKASKEYDTEDVSFDSDKEQLTSA